tara:strand:- start:115 stop:519 length:405 start_codon:yes stop_codon:yes gene_type:complete
MHNEIKLLGKVSKEILIKNEIFKDKQLNNVGWFFSGFSEFRIPLQSKIIGYYSHGFKNDNNTVEAILISITQSYFIPLEEIDKGWRNIIGIQFILGIPKHFTKLIELKTWDEYLEDEVIHLILKKNDLQSLNIE